MRKDSQSMVNEIGARAKQAAASMAQLNAGDKNRMLLHMAAALREESDAILAQNALDVTAAKEKGLRTAFIDRLTLTPGRIDEMAKGLEDLTALKDPVGEILGGWKGAQDIEILKLRVPIGVIGMIYEARPNVTADAAGICFKTGNAVILRGSGEAKESNKAVVKALRSAISAEGGPAGRRAGGCCAASGRHKPGGCRGTDEDAQLSGFTDPQGRSGPDPDGAVGIHRTGD